MAAGNKKRGRIILLILAIVILCGVLVFAVYQYSSGLFNPNAGQPLQPAAEPAPQVQMVDIIVTTQAVQRGAELSESVLTTVPYPQDQYVQGTFFTAMDEVIGKRVRMDLASGTPLTPGVLAESSGSGSIASFEIPRGLVALSIPVNRLTSVSALAEAGDHVNVIASLLMIELDANTQSRTPNRSGYVFASGPRSEYGGDQVLTAEVRTQDFSLGTTTIDGNLGQAVYSYPTETQRPRLVSQTLIQDAIVLSVGGPQAAAPAQTATQTADGQQQAQAAAAATTSDIIALMVTPQDAVTLNYLMLAGAQLNLALRGAGDDQRISTESVTLQFIMDQYNFTNPAKLPYGLEPRMDSFPTSIQMFPESSPSQPWQTTTGQTTQ